MMSAPNTVTGFQKLRGTFSIDFTILTTYILKWRQFNDVSSDLDSHGH